MSTDVEELLREGMERFTEGVRAPAGLARTAGRLHRRRRTARAAVAGGTAAVTAAAGGAVIITRGPGTRPAAARPGAHGRVRDQPGRERARQPEHGLCRAHAEQHREIHDHVGHLEIRVPGPDWRIRAGSRWCPSRGACTHHGGSGLALADGTALVGGKLVSAYVTYYNREFSLSRLVPTCGARVCSTTAALELGGPSTRDKPLAAFMTATYRSGAATVTRHVQWKRWRHEDHREAGHHQASGG